MLKHVLTLLIFVSFHLKWVNGGRGDPRFYYFGEGGSLSEENFRRYKEVMDEFDRKQKEEAKDPNFKVRRTTLDSYNALRYKKLMEAYGLTESEEISFEITTTTITTTTTKPVEQMTYEELMAAVERGEWVKAITDFQIESEPDNGKFDWKMSDEGSSMIHEPLDQSSELEGMSEYDSQEILKTSDQIFEDGATKEEHSKEILKTSDQIFEDGATKEEHSKEILKTSDYFYYVEGSIEKDSKELFGNSEEPKVDYSEEVIKDHSKKVIKPITEILIEYPSKEVIKDHSEEVIKPIHEVVIEYNKEVIKDNSEEIIKDHSEDVITDRSEEVRKRLEEARKRLEEVVIKYYSKEVIKDHSKEVIKDHSKEVIKDHSKEILEYHPKDNSKRLVVSYYFPNKQPNIICVEIDKNNPYDDQIGDPDEKNPEGFAMDFVLLNVLPNEYFRVHCKEIFLSNSSKSYWSVWKHPIP